MEVIDLFGKGGSPFALAGKAREFCKKQNRDPEPIIKEVNYPHLKERACFKPTF